MNESLYVSINGQWKEEGDPAEVMIATVPEVVVSARWLVSSAGCSPGCRATAEGCPLQIGKKRINGIKDRLYTAKNWLGNNPRGRLKFLHSISSSWKNPILNSTEPEEILLAAPSNKQQQHQSDIYPRNKNGEKRGNIDKEKKIDSYCQGGYPLRPVEHFHPRAGSL